MFLVRRCASCFWVLVVWRGEFRVFGIQQTQMIDLLAAWYRNSYAGAADFAEPAVRLLPLSNPEM